MTQVPSTTEEIEAIYASGLSATVALIQQLLELLASQQQTITQLTGRIEELEERLGRNSRNSNQPPSSDGFNRPPPPRSLRQSTGRKVGGQPGHKGKTLRFSDMPDSVEVHSPQQCVQCGCCLEGVMPSAWESRQVIDLPPMRLETVEHRAQSVHCPLCANLNKAPFPDEVSESVQYGPRIKALGVYLMSYQLLPYERTAELLSDLFGATPCKGTLYRAQQSGAEKLEGVEETIREGLRRAEVAHFDETGLYIGGKRHWLHVACTSQLTLYLSHPNRGEAATREMGVLPGYGGVAVHDGYNSYRAYQCRHALCNAHHLRELTALQEMQERGGQEQAWAEKMKQLLLEIKASVGGARDAQQRGLPQGTLLEFEGRYRQLVAEGLKGNPPNPPPIEPRRGRVKQSKAYNLLVRLRDGEGAVLRFMHDFRVPFDNNQAERDLRMAKVQQKVSGCFRSHAGAAAFCRLRGYISTLRKQGLHVFSALQQLFRAAPVIPYILG